MIARMARAIGGALRSRAARVAIWFLAVAVCVSGAGVSYYLTLKHLKTTAEEKQQEEERSLLDEVCGAFTYSDCEEVSKSPYGVFPFGASKDEFHVPTALLGLFYFTAVLGWFLLIGGCTASRWWAHLVLAAVAAFGLGVSILLDYKMLFEVLPETKAWCPLCVATHVGSLLLFVFVLLLWPRRAAAAAEGVPAEQQDREARAARPVWPHWWMLVVTPVVILLAISTEYLLFKVAEAAPAPQAVVAHVPSELAESQPAGEETPLTGSPAEQVEQLKDKLKKAQDLARYWKQQFDWFDSKWQHAYLSWNLTPRVEIHVEGEPFIGPQNARHTMVIYSDFQCPYCKDFEEYLRDTIMPLGAQLGGLKLVFKHWPICTDCNTYETNNRHPVACRASQAVEAARIVGGDQAYWRMYELLWQQQAQWKKTQSFGELARAIGLDEQAFLRAMDSGEATQRIQANIEEGANLGKDVLKKEEYEFVKVTSTPAVFVDGKRVWRLRKSKLLWTNVFRAAPVAQSQPSSR